MGDGEAGKLRLVKRVFPRRRSVGLATFGMAPDVITTRDRHDVPRHGSRQHITDAIGREHYILKNSCYLAAV
jgi:hypothetical protein